MAERIASVRDGLHATRPLIARQSSRRTELAPATLCLFVAITPLAFAAPLFEPYITPKEVLVQAGTTTVVLLWIITARRESSTLTFTPVWLPILGLIVIGSLSILWSSNRSASTEEARRLSIYVLLFALTLQVMQRTDIRALMVKALVLAGTMESVYVLLQYSFGDPIFLTARLPGKWRTFGTLGNPNWTGEFLAVTALVTLGQLIELRKESTRTWSHHGALAALMLMLLALVATLARGSWLAVIMGATAFLIARRYFQTARRALKSAFLPLAVTGVAAALVVGLPLLYNRQALDHLLNLKSVRGRIWMMIVTATMIRDAPFGGHGLGTFGSQFPLYQARTFSRPWSAPFMANASFTTYAHNDYLQIWAELGLIGVLAFGALIWIVVRRGRALAGDPLALGCWAAVISLLVNAAVAFPLHLPASLMLFVVLVALIEGAARHAITRSYRPARVAWILVVLLAVAFALVIYRAAYRQLAADFSLRRADVAFATQSWPEAEAQLQTAMPTTPQRQAAHAMLGRIRLERGDHAGALEAFNQAMGLGFDVDVYDWKALTLERMDKRVEAAATLKELIWLRPDLQWPRQRLATLERKDGI